jgi:hypothetical protein
MKCKWLLENDVFEDNLENIKAAILQNGMFYKCIDYRPFLYKYEFDDFYDLDDCVVFYGSLNLANQIKRNIGWNPGVYCNLSKLECSHYYNYLGQFLLNKDYLMIPFGELARQKELLFKVFGVDETIFVRPSSGFKDFTGQLMTVSTYARDLERMALYDIDFDKMVVVSSPKVIGKEWRMICIDGKVVTGSRYRDNGTESFSPEVPAEVYELANQIVQTWQPESAFTLDIGEHAGYNALIELNSFSCAGWYGADLVKTIKAASDIAVRDWEELR